MRTFLHSGVLALSLLFFPAAPLRGQDQPAQLADLVGLLLENNAEIRAAQFRFEAATKRPMQLSTLPDPKLVLVNFGVGQPFSRLNTSDFAYRAIGVSQEIPFPGKLRLAAEEAEREADSERENYRSVILEKTSQLKVAYYEWFLVSKAIEINAKNRDLLTRFEQIARARYSVGRGIQPDVLRAQVEISNSAQQLELLEQRKAVAEARIRSLVKGEIPLARPADIRQSPFTLQLEAVLELVESQSPRLRASQAMVQSRAVAIDRARREYRPDFNVSVQWQKTGSQFPDYYMAMAEVKLPVYFRRKQQLGVEEATARFEESRYDHEAALQDIVFEAKDRYFTVRTSERLLALYQSAIIPQSSLALESAFAGYEVGNVDFLTLLTNAITVVDFEMRFYEELARHEQALAQLEPLIGMELTRP